MRTLVLILVVCSFKYRVESSKLPGPLVYVVTPRPVDHGGRSADRPFYYHSWKRMDTPTNITTTTPKVKTQDLIFAEFEADKTKNIRKLLEKERIVPKVTTTTSKPIYVAEEVHDVKPDYSSQPTEQKEHVSQDKDMTDYFALYHNKFGPDPVYIPSTTTIPQETTETAKETTPPPIHNVENIWHIIDNEKHNQYSGGWNEVPVSSDNEGNSAGHEGEDINKQQEDDDTGSKFDEHFAIPGFGTNPGNGAENESRAIRTESDARFPYVSLKPFQMKNLKKPSFNTLSHGKNGNMYTSLDNFSDIKNPVRGEAQDAAVRPPIDRYNSAQPYLPKYGGKSKQSSPGSPPAKAMSNLVPPPPPPPPKVTADDFPAPNSYEAFPPYPPSSFPSYDAGPPPQKPIYQPPMESADDSDSGPPTDDSEGPAMDLGYRYKPPSPPSQSFLPTLPPLTKPGGYSYEKPPMADETGPDEKPDFQGYHYDKPAPSKDHPPYGHHDDYPELVFSKPHGPMTGMKGGHDMKGDDMGMVPPPPPAMGDAGPPDDSGFPQDFPGDFKYHHFDDHDHDFYHHHHHHTTTAAPTTTEQARVNRYSYYYLGKKLYYLPLYFSVYFIIYVGALIIKAVLRHKIVYPNSWRPNDTTASFFAKRSLDSWNPSHDNLHEITGKVTHAIANAAETYLTSKEES